MVVPNRTANAPVVGCSPCTTKLYNKAFVFTHKLDASCDAGVIMSPQEAHNLVWHDGKTSAAYVGSHLGTMASHIPSFDYY